MIRSECKEIIWGLGDNSSIRQAFIELFDAISDDAMIRELPAVTHILPCYDENSGLQPGDWAPEIHLVLRKVEDVETRNSSPDDAAPGDDDGGPEEEETP